MKRTGALLADGVTLEAFAVDRERQLRQLTEQLSTWRYRPHAPRVVEVPKRSGGRRQLAIFNVCDRITQQAVNQILLPYWDKRFAPCSYAYRPGRGARQAIEAVQRDLNKARTWVVDADIEKFFDNVQHQQLFARLESWIDDESVRTLLEMMLTSGSPNGLGLPQGSAIAPLLSNLYLHSFDEALLQRGYALHRYADDFVLLCPTQQQAMEALRTSHRLLSALQLRLNEHKTRIVHLSQGFDFLGFTFTPEGKRPSDKAVESLQQRLNRTSDAMKRERIQTGWQAYFGENVNRFVDSTEGPRPIQHSHSSHSAFDRSHITIDSNPDDDPPFDIDDSPNEVNDLWLDGGGDGSSARLLSNTDMQVFMSRFVCRRDAFAKYWENSSGRRGYVPVRRAITTTDIKAHLDGTEILGSYMLNSDGQTNALVFDVDGPTADQAGREKAHKLTMRMLGELQQKGIRPLLFDSGGKGRHIWLCFTNPVASQPLREWAQSFLDGFRPFPNEVLVEVFPKQDFISSNTLGSMLRLPLGKHPGTGRFGALLDTGGQPVSDPWQVLREQELIKPSVFSQPTVTITPDRIPSPPDEVAPMIQGCALLRALVEKAAQTGDLKHTERLALLYTVGRCGDAGRAHLHQIIALCGNYDPHVTERFIQRLEPGHKPIRCVKLKEWLRDYLPDTVCQCPSKKKNPSPLDLLQVSEKSAENRKRSASNPVADDEWNAVADDLFKF